MKILIEGKLPYDWRRMIVVCLIALMIGGDLCLSTSTSWAVNRSHPALPVSAEGGVPAMMEKAHRPGQFEVVTRIEEIMRRPEFQNARWGMKFYSPDTGQVIYSINSDQLFQPASAVKVFVAGSAFDALGPDYLFRTQVYRTGPLVDGVLKGDLVLVAGGDLLLGGRVQPDGSLALPDPDHTYDLFPGALPVTDDPLRSIRRIARQVAARRLKRIEGRVLVDASLFREVQDEVGGSEKVTVSPMMINDNLVDIVVTPGSFEGEPGALCISPETAYVKIVNQTNTTAASEPPPPFGPGALRFVDDVANADGTHTVTLTGNIPLGSQPVLRAYRIPEPARFAEIALAEELCKEGISAEVDLLANPDFQALSAFYKPKHRVAKIVPPPLSEQVKVMLKVSSNPHTIQWPYLVGAIAGGERENAKETGKEFQRRLFEKVGLEPPSGDVFEGLYTADFFIKFLTYMSQQSYFPEYLTALPIMGKDGGLANVQPNSPAAGHVYAKTGSGGSLGPGNTTHVNKALAGFIELPDGGFIVFVVFLAIDGQISLEGIRQFDQTMGEIASVVYESLAH